MFIVNFRAAACPSVLKIASVPVNGLTLCRTSAGNTSSCPGTGWTSLVYSSGRMFEMSLVGCAPRVSKYLFFLVQRHFKEREDGHQNSNAWPRGDKEIACIAMCQHYISTKCHHAV